MKGSYLVWFEVTCQQFLGDKNYENPENGLRAGKDSNVVPPERKSNTLLLEPPRLVNCCDNYCQYCFIWYSSSKDTACTCVVCALVLPYRDCECLRRRCVYLSAAVSTGQAIRLSRDNGPEIRAEEYQLSELRVVSDIITTSCTANWPPKCTCTKTETLWAHQMRTTNDVTGAGRSQRSPEYCQRDFEPLRLSWSLERGITVN